MQYPGMLGVEEIFTNRQFLAFIERMEDSAVDEKTAEQLYSDFLKEEAEKI